MLRSGAHARVADLGTGSGAIALAIASERPSLQRHGVDVSSEALEIATRNAARLQLAQRRASQRGSWFAPLAGQRFDVIASNPPYIAHDDPDLAPDVAVTNPTVALIAGVTGLEAIEQIVAQARPRICSPAAGSSWSTAGNRPPRCANDLCATGFAHVRSHADLAGHERVTEGRSVIARQPTALQESPCSNSRPPRAASRCSCSTSRRRSRSRTSCKYVDEGFFDGTVFHRVIPGFMIQGGGLTADLKNKPGHEPIKNEATNGLKNKRGTLSMARTNDINSATSQFFINLVDNDFLDHKPGNYGYAVFGRIDSGMEVVDAIAAVKTGNKGTLPGRADRDRHHRVGHVESRTDPRRIEPVLQRSKRWIGARADFDSDRARAQFLIRCCDFAASILASFVLSVGAVLCCCAGSIRRLRPS